MLERMCTRARIPVQYTGAFNPHMKMSLVVPRQVAVASDDELLVVQLTEPIDADTFRTRLAATAPEGLNILECRKTAARPPQAAAVHYCVTLDDSHTIMVDQAVTKFDQAQSASITRPRRGRHPERTIDLKEGVRHIRVDHIDNTLQVTIGCSRQATARLGELLTYIGLDDPGILAQTKRTHIEWQTDTTVTTQTSPRVQYPPTGGKDSFSG